MNTLEKIKAHYNFTSGDVKNLLRLKPAMEARSGDFVVEFYNYVKNFDEAGRYLKDEATVKRHQDALKVWFVALFSGDYGHTYFAGLEKIGMAHVKITLPAHYVNAAMHFVKIYAQGVVAGDVADADECLYLQGSVEKILDINLDVLTSSYIEEEKKYFLSQKVESYLIHMANRYSYGLNLTLVVGLMLLGVMVIGLFVYDFVHILDGNIEKGLLSTLGSLLMLWVVIELIDTEVKHLKGGKFAIRIFISVAMVSIIRKILVTSLKSEAVEAQISLIAAVAVLGVVYWLISRVET
jgi:uncharacterized membrane protein (DUF373 family)